VVVVLVLVGALLQALGENEPPCRIVRAGYKGRGGCSSIRETAKQALRSLPFSLLLSFARGARSPRYELSSAPSRPTDHLASASGATPKACLQRRLGSFILFDSPPPARSKRGCSGSCGTSRLTATSLPSRPRVSFRHNGNLLAVTAPAARERALRRRRRGLTVHRQASLSGRRYSGKFTRGLHILQALGGCPGFRSEGVFQAEKILRLPPSVDSSSRNPADW